ncbi:hypothetical protein HID58_038479, partial [Brassica napus]
GNLTRPPPSPPDPPDLSPLPPLPSSSVLLPCSTVLPDRAFSPVPGVLKPSLSNTGVSAADLLASYLISPKSTVQIPKSGSAQIPNFNPLPGSMPTSSLLGSAPSIFPLQTPLNPRVAPIPSNLNPPIQNTAPSWADKPINNTPPPVDAQYSMPPPLDSSPLVAPILMDIDKPPSPTSRDTSPPHLPLSPISHSSLLLPDPSISPSPQPSPDPNDPPSPPQNYVLALAATTMPKSSVKIPLLDQNSPPTNIKPFDQPPS